MEKSKSAIASHLSLWAGLLLGVVAQLVHADEFVPFRPDLPAGTKCKIEVSLLHPTQAAVGMYEVQLRSNKMQKWSAAKLDAYMRGKVAPVVVGPGNLVYLLDHHHLARVLADTKLSPTLYAVVKGSHAHLAARDFWKLMTEQHWVFLLDEAGHELKDPSQLPTAIRDMRDDPYRSLAWMVREQGGYNLSGAFFAEFQWANYFRHRIPFETTPAGYGQATAAALKISHDPAAKDLPGFIAP